MSKRDSDRPEVKYWSHRYRHLASSGPDREDLQTLIARVFDAGLAAAQPPPDPEVVALLAQVRDDLDWIQERSVGPVHTNANKAIDRLDEALAKLKVRP